jgi:TRAP transporter 4TM/12TM fusion protein
MREFKGKFAVLFGIWAIIAVGFHLYTALYGTLEPRLQRSVHVFLLLPLVFIVFPFRVKTKKPMPTIIDWLLAFLALLPSLYIILNADVLSTRIEQVTPVTPVQTILGSLLIILVLEACRRAVSLSFAIVVTVAFSYIFIAPYLPGLFNSRNLGYERVVEIMYLSSHDGLYGFLTGISSNIIFVFIIFAAIMVYSGVGQFFMDLSILVAGKYRGGPAKVSVLSSALFGSISGSSVSDIYATGSFTVPLMKKIGYPSTKAGAIEAVSSAGGPLLPPVMGAGAFIMAEMTATPYTEIIKAALLGALIFYIGVLAMVHFEAVAMGLTETPKDLRVPVKTVLIQLPYIIPFVVLAWFLFSGSSPANSAVYGLIAMMIIWLLLPGNRLTLKKLIEAVSYAARMGTVIVSALTGASIIVTVINQSGLALSLSNIIVQSSSGQLWLALLLIMVTTIVLGAGIPTTAAYVITATVSAAALTAFDVNILTAHLFIFYFAILADITPPVGVTAFSAANVANSPPMKTALFSVKYAFAGFVVPFIFVYHPALLMSSDFTMFEIGFTFVSAILSVIVLAAAIMGIMFTKLSVLQRILLLIFAISAISTNELISYSSMILMIAFILWNYFKMKKMNHHKDASLQLTPGN